MHYFVAVLIPPTCKNVEKEVKKLLKKHNGRKWDWYQLGGRWTGAYDGYDPSKDRKNWKKCDICGGTGERKDVAPEDFKKGYCNGCSPDKEFGCPTGTHVKWPTGWEPRKGDVAPVKIAKKKTLPHSIVTPDGKWLEADVDWHNYGKPTQKEWDKKKAAAVKEWKTTALSLFEKHKDYVAVIVDCHN